jgi:hypothetical protein
MLRSLLSSEPILTTRALLLLCRVDENLVVSDSLLASVERKVEAAMARMDLQIDGNEETIGKSFFLLLPFPRLVNFEKAPVR